jgi:hypothetical protein
MTPQELLAKAADDIAEHGHNKGTYHDPDAGLPQSTAPACAYGALTRAATGGRTTDYAWIGVTVKTWETKGLIDQAAELLARVVVRRGGIDYGNDFGTIALYNDRDDVTGEDVILAMKDAAHG